MSNKTLLQRLSWMAHMLPADHTAIDSPSPDTNQAVQYTCSELYVTVAHLAEWLRHQQVAVVVLHLSNSPHWVLVDLACQVAGLVCVPMPIFFSEHQQRHCLRELQAGLWLTDHPQAVNQWPEMVDVTGPETCPLPGIYVKTWCLTHQQAVEWPQGTQKITFTSGSTGDPKGVCLSVDHQWQIAESLADAVAVTAPRHLCLLPLATLLENIAGVYTPLLRGGTVVVMASDHWLHGSSGLQVAALTQVIEAQQPHTLILIPQMLTALVAACAQGWKAPASLRFLAVGGASVAPALIEQARACGLPVYEGYGLSECGSVVSLNTPDHDKPGSAGRILPHCQVSDDGGEIQITGACHLGYLGLPDSWYPTSIASGDLGTLDSDGFLQIQGRKKHLIISSFGRNISPEWVESQLLSQPLLSHCVVVGDARPALAALLSAPASISNQRIQTWINHINDGLPDYAQVKQWLRLPTIQWQGLLTANGRPRRQTILHVLSELIDGLYRETLSGLP